jgi:hypothetical protein
MINLYKLQKLFVQCLTLINFKNFLYNVQPLQTSKTFCTMIKFHKVFADVPTVQNFSVGGHELRRSRKKWSA